MQKIAGLFFFFFFCIFSLFSEEDELQITQPEQIIDFIEENDQLVAGLISPLSGNICQRTCDLIAKGAQNVALYRIYSAPFIPSAFNADPDWDEYELYTYISSHLKHKGWTYCPHIWLHKKVYKDVTYIRFSTPTGIRLDYKLDGNKTTLVDEKCIGISNYCGELPSAKFDFRNVHIQEQGDLIIVKTPDGKSYHYQFGRPLNEELIRYYLQKEVLPNGKMLKYTYKNDALLEMYSCDPTEKHRYASIKISLNPTTDFETNTGINATYYYDAREKAGIVESQHHKRKFHMQSPQFLAKVSSPFYRNETMEYCPRFLLETSNNTEPFSCSYVSCKREIDPISHQRVQTLFRPKGTAWEPLYHLEYNLPIAGKKRGSTTVSNPDGTKTEYLFNKMLLTSAIKYYGIDGELKREKVFYWSKTNWLEAIEIKDGKNNCLVRKSYTYDSYGNPIQEVTSGNISGNNIIENVTIKRKFSTDGRNLLLREENEQGETILYTYLPGTNLKLSKLTLSGNKIILREFYDYDASHNLVAKISDDGITNDKNNLSGVQERTITQYILRKSQPFLHMPEKIIEKYSDGKGEKILKSTLLHYDSYGNVCREEIYDADGTFRYAILKEYDEADHLLSETNALGQKATFEYDAKGRQTKSCNFSQNITKEKRYDAIGRLKKNTEKTKEGIQRSKSYLYDGKNRIIKETDYHNHTTTYMYDLTTDKVAKEEKPSIYSSYGLQNVILSKTYDSFGRALTKTDENGNTTSYLYNMYGSPIEICYPNGAKETFKYNKRNKVVSHTNQEGLTIFYDYDALDRVISKKYSFGKTLATESFGFNGFHLIKKVNKDGIETLYSYDGAGRKIKEETAGKVTEYVYDSLGRNSKVIKHNHENTLVIEYEFDLLDRIVQKVHKDLLGKIYYKIQYEYDADGNRNAITRFVNNQPTTEKYEYDSFGRIIKCQDAHGITTTYSYDDHFVNSYGQVVTRTIKIDPEGVKTVDVEDPYARIINKEISQNDKTLSILENSFDPCGNLVEQKDHVFVDGKFVRYQIIRQSYNSMNLLESMIRAYGTNEERKTYQTYTPSGKLACKILPDQTQLIYTYSLLGYLSTLKSSNNQIDHTFEYNKEGYLTNAFDNVNKVSIQRELDACGNILKEHFSTGLEIKKNYDLFDRPLTIDLGKNGKITYQYDSCHLRKVIRHTTNATYTHSYDFYDLNGNLLTESLIGLLGPVTHAYDPTGRKTSISSSYLTENYFYSPTGNLLSKNDTSYGYDGLSQLTLEKNSITENKYQYDSLYNRAYKNDEGVHTNELNELLTQGNLRCSYNLNGNLIQKNDLNLTYDPLNRLIQAENDIQKIHFAYDPLGRRLSKVVLDNSNNETLKEYYLYDGQEEMGAISSNGKAKQLKIPGLVYQKLSLPIAIELNEKVFAPICDNQRNVRSLVSVDSKQEENNYAYNSFGELQDGTELTSFNPWRYSLKRWDPETNLIYYGHRYYSPELARWLSPDPAGFHDSHNLYQYLLNNPHYYVDPDGRLIQTLPFVVYFTLEFGTWAVNTALVVIGVSCIELYSQHMDAVAEKNDAKHYFEKKEKGSREKAPYNPGNDPTICPGEGFEWRGTGEPGSSRGAWHNSQTDESLHPDLNHKDPIGPHWDYRDKDNNQGRIDENGIIEWK